MNTLEINKRMDKRHERRPADVTSMVYGKIPPQAREMEEAVLGAIMLERDAFDAAQEILQPEMFYMEAHQRIFKAMKALAAKSQPIEILTVCEELRQLEDLETVGGRYYVTNLTQSVVSSTNLPSHAKIIFQKYIQRELIRVSGEIIGRAYEDAGDPFELLDEAGEALNLIGQAISLNDMVPMSSVIVSALKKIEEWRGLDTTVTGVPSGFEDLDKATRGWQDGDLIILAARPSVGKTAFALNLVRNAALKFLQDNQSGKSKDTKSVAVWSLEMKSLMLVLRMLAAESQEVLYRIQTGRLDDQAMKRIYQQGVQKLARLNVFFDDNPGLTLPKLRSKARKLKKKNALGLIVIDYMQLMTPDERAGTREQEVSRISRGLKNLAQELQVPIIALSQLSREIEKRAGHQRKPQLSDLRESGSLEQDADVVAFLWGPTDDEIGQDASLLGRRYLRLAKQRNGVLLTMELNFKDEIQLFSEIANLPGLFPGYRPVQTTVDFTAPKDKEEEPF